MAKKRFIPFALWPAHWGLAGSLKERAKIEYELQDDPVERDMKIAELNLSGKELERAKLDIKERHGVMTGEEVLKEKIQLMEPGEAKELMELAHRRTYERMSDLEYEKAVATIKKEPWVAMPHLGTSDDPREGEFELDWNSYFIEQLEASGYIGRTEDEVIQQWFHEICKNVALEVYDGVGDFNDKIEEAGPAGRSTKSKKKKAPTGRTEIE